MGLRDRPIAKTDHYTFEIDPCTVISNVRESSFLTCCSCKYKFPQYLTDCTRRLSFFRSTYQSHFEFRPAVSITLSMHSSNILSIWAAGTLLISASSAGSSVKSISKVFQFGQDAGIENLAVRPNGNILFTESSPAAKVWEINPLAKNGSAIVRAQFPNVTTALGISSIGNDMFAITTGDVGADFAGRVGTFAVHLLAYTGADTAEITKTIDIPQGKLVNKITPMDPISDVILISDSQSYSILAVSISTGEIRTVLQDAETMTATDSFPIGVNGIRTLGNNLYYTNSAQGLFCHVELYDDGTAAGSYEIIANISSKLLLPNDFAILPTGEAFIAGSNEVLYVQPNGAYSVFVGAELSLELAGATSALFGVGPTADVLYLTSNGKDSSPGNSTVVVPGSVTAIEVDRDC